MNQQHFTTSEVSYYQPADAKAARWSEAREMLRRYRTATDLDAFAKDYYDAFPDCPPDQFDQIASNGERFHNGSARKWAGVRAAVSGKGWARRLESQVLSLEFLTAQAKHFGLGDDYTDASQYHSPSFVRDWREAIREQVPAPFWWRVEVGVNGLVHPHLICASGAFGGPGVRRDVYDLEGLVRYLKKGIPYTPENLAVHLKARVALLRAGKRRGPSHSGTHGVPNSRTWIGPKSISA